MRDGWTRGLGLPKPAQKYFRMLEREADWHRSDRMRDQALAVLQDACHRELAPAFRSAIQQMRSAPTAIELQILQSLACTSPLGSEIVGHMLCEPNLAPREALHSALAIRSGQLISELKRCYAMEKGTLDRAALAAFSAALESAADIVISEMLDCASQTASLRRPSLSENLL